MVPCANDYRSSHATTDAVTDYERTYKSGYYAALWAKIERPLVETTLRALGGPDKKCLDFACGTGRIANVAAEHFAEVVGVDVSPAMLAQARCPDNVRLRQIDITRHSLSERFDVVTAFRFFLNAGPLLREEALEALREHLHDGGHLVYNVQMNATSPIGVALRVANRIPGLQLRNTMSIDEQNLLLRSTGFLVQEVVPYGFLPRPGSFLPRVCEACIWPVERIASALRVPERFAQQFLVVAKRR
jgi:cyclopropane fatty-acyl-phospholipid synthase-like methyltransferase